MDKTEKKEEQESSNISIKQIINEIQDKTDVFRSTTGEAFIKTKNDNKIASIDSTDFENWLRRFCYHQMNSTYLPSGAVQQVTGYLRMLADNSEIKKLHRRIYNGKNAIYYDLGLDGCRYLKISKEKIGVVKNSKILMMRSSVFCEQVMPDLEGNPEEIPSFVKKHFHFSSGSENILFSVFLVASFFSDTMPMPLIQLYGEKASGKTFCEKRILDLINPVSAGVFALPKKIDDIAMCLSSDYIVAFDNIGWINEEVSNLLCIACTGGMISKRKLFTDNTQMLRDLKTITIFNSVNQCVTKSDLADRILTFYMERFSQEDRRGEQELREEWEQDKPRFFGDICLAVQGILGDDKSVEYSSPFRLVDFYELAVKAGRQLGFSEEDVYNAFEKNHNVVNDAIIAGDIVLMTIEQYMAQWEEDKVLVFTPTDFYTTLKKFAQEELSVSRGFPGSSSAFSRKLGECRSNLQDIGIYFDRHKPNNRIIEIWKSKK